MENLARDIGAAAHETTDEEPALPPQSVYFQEALDKCIDQCSNLGVQVGGQDNATQCGRFSQATVFSSENTVCRCLQ